MAIIYSGDEDHGDEITSGIGVPLGIGVNWPGDEDEYDSELDEV